MPETGGLESLVASLEQQARLHEPDNLYQRIEALELLDICFPEVEQCRSESRGAAVETPLESRASALRLQLEAENRRLFDSIRLDVQQGRGPGLLLQWVTVLNSQDAQQVEATEGYDFLDVLVSGVLQFDEPTTIAALLPDMVFYQPTSARHIFDFIGRAALGDADVLVDLGSGLGHVPLLAAICGVRSIGIEWEQAYVHCAQRCARALNLPNVTFMQHDVRNADLSTGTVFYLYTPFTGAMLREVLDLLRRQAMQRHIRVCTFGPCTATVASESWLQLAEPLRANRVAIFHSRRASATS